MSFKIALGESVKYRLLYIIINERLGLALPITNKKRENNKYCIRHQSYRNEDILEEYILLFDEEIKNYLLNNYPFDDYYTNCHIQCLPKTFCCGDFGHDESEQKLVNKAIRELNKFIEENIL